MGMTEEEYQEKVTELIFYFVVAPAIILIGMAMTGAIIDELLNLPDDGFAFSRIFAVIGGIPGIAIYYRKLWFDFKGKAEISE